ncbi:MAG: pilus assembly protein [Nocardioides sp.]|uniref:TadE family type IV pilus minor pilin n=1 Tax=Nocardioides sp. TaxID=35761 RepID=UPI0039E70AA0
MRARGVRRGERGAATAELVMVLPMLVAVTVGLVWLLSVGAAQLRTIDAARETARAMARGDDPSSAVARGQQVGPSGTRIRVSAGAEEVAVDASASVRGPGGLFGWLPGVTVHAHAVAEPEPTAE